MLVKAKLNYLRIAPRKVRLVADSIRGKKASEALIRLRFLDKKAALPMKKLLQSAVANATNNLQLEEDSLNIFKIAVDEGPKLKRWRAASRGHAASIQKKTSHITLVLEGQTKKNVTVSSQKKEKPTAETKTETQKNQGVQAKEDAMVKKTIRAKKEMGSSKDKAQKGVKRVFKRKAF